MFSVPFWDDGESFSVNAGAAITGARFVKASGGTVNGLINVVLCTAGADPIGVSASDAASGDALLLHRSRDIIAPVTAGGALTADTLVESDANGQAITHSTGIVCGRVLADCASGDLAMIDRSARAT